MSSVAFKGQAVDMGTGQSAVGSEELTLVWVRTHGVWMLRHQPIYPAARDRQLRHHDWTTIHVWSALPPAVRCP